MSEIDIYDGIGICQSGDVILILWTTDSRAHRVVWIGRKIDQFMRNGGPRDFLYLQVVFSTSAPPDAGARAASRDALEKMLPKLRRMITVAQGDALWMNIVRIVMRGMALAQRQSDTQFTEATVHKGLDRIQEAQTPQTPKRDVLIGDLLRMAKMLNLDPATMGLDPQPQTAL